MIELIRQQEPGGNFVLHRLERHGPSLYTVVYKSPVFETLGRAATAIDRHRPTVNELRQGVQVLMKLGQTRRCVVRQFLTGVYTYTRESSGHIVEYPYFFDPNGDEASGELLEKFLLEQCG